MKRLNIRSDCYEMEPWAPDEIFTYLWHDFSREDSLTLGQFDRIEKAEDLSNNGLDVTSEATGSEPTLQRNELNGKSVAYFPMGTSLSTGVTDFTGDKNWGYIVVSQPIRTQSYWSSIVSYGDAYEHGGVKWEILSADNANLEFDGSVNGMIFKRRTLSFNQNNVTTWNIWGWNYEWDITHATSFLNGNIMTENKLKMEIDHLHTRYRYARNRDGYWFLECKIAEALMFRVEDREKIEGYLAWKWGFENELPASHPYKNGAPMRLKITKNRLSVSNFAAFNLNNIPNLVGWYDGADKEYMEIDNQNKIKTWMDKSALNNDLVQPTPVRRPELFGNFLGECSVGLPGEEYGVKTTPSDIWMYSESKNFDFSRGGFTFFVVLTGKEFNEQWKSILSLQYYNKGISLMLKDTTWHAYQKTEKDYIWGESPDIDTGSETDMFLITYSSQNVQDGKATLEINKFKNEIEFVGEPVQNTNGWFFINSQEVSTWCANWVYHEIAIFNRYLTDYEKSLVQGKLAMKWNIRNKLPEDHIYS
jgi:hypothetical protein